MVGTFYVQCGAYEYICKNDWQPAYISRSNFVSFGEEAAHRMLVNLFFIVKIIPFDFQAVCML